MKINKLISFIIVVGFIFPLFSFSNEKIKVGKMLPNKRIPKVHPYTSRLSTPEIASTNRSKSPNYQKLLVLLVDFQEDNDANTTGNGKFQTTIDENYGPTLGSPPHNQEFYNYQLEAMKYYYRAVSYESYQLEYEVFPKTGEAYTLPHPMSYYNPGVQNQELFISRVEEYFRDIFQTADQDSQIVFGNYGHFMIIHAGSDWQHDVMGDTPYDIPSFFIKMGDGKEVWVDDHQTMINHACNVPETITQDIQSEENEDGSVYYTGYGVINSVMAHEFGHSLGLVDLYNVRNFNPEVGYFDIMDSGGQGVAVDRDGNLFYGIEGAIPCLPGAWSRCLLFRDDYIQRGILKEISSKMVEFDKDLFIRPAEEMIQIKDNIPRFYQLPLNENEYLLIENRSVDPDSDGGMEIQSALDFRIALHPTPVGLPGFNYEYDWMLPSWMGLNDKTYGGGLLIWHIDNNRLYGTGTTDSDGTFVSNFENNTVNTIHSKRSVKLIEADNIQDIGNEYSWYWQGTPYEYFFKYKPLLDENGVFLDWLENDNSIHSDSLSAIAKPALIMNNGKPSNWVIHNISQSANPMSFKISNLLFNNTQYLEKPDSTYAVAPFSHALNQTDSDLFLLNSDRSVIYTHAMSTGYDHWDEIWNDDFTVNPDFPILTMDLDKNLSDDFVIVDQNKIHFLNYQNYSNMTILPTITDTPVLLSKADNYLAVSTLTSTSIIKCHSDFTFSLVQSFDRHGKICSDSVKLYILDSGKLSVVKEENQIWSIENEFIINDQFTKYNPVVFRAQNDQSVQLFMLSDNQILWTWKDNKVEKIFNVKDFTNESCTNLSLSLDSNGYLSLVFAAGSKVFKIFRDGSLSENFPVILQNSLAKPFSNISVIRKTGICYYLFNDQNSGIFSIDENGAPDPATTMYWDKGNIEPVWYHEASTNRLYSVFNDRKNNLYISWSQLNNNDALIWSGYKNNGSSYFSGTTTNTPVISDFSAYIYPNPVKSNSFRIKLENPKNTTEIKIYNISGSLVYQKTLIQSTESYQDLQISAEKLASGIYIAIADDGQTKKKIKFAVIK